MTAKRIDMPTDADRETHSDKALSISSANFESRKFRSIDDNTLHVSPTVGSLAFSLIFLLLGLGLAGLWIAGMFTSFDGPGWMPALLVGLLFFVVGLATYHKSNEQVIINRDVGIAFMRSWHPSPPLDMASVSKHLQANEIIAVQTISRIVRHRTNRSKRSSTFTEYQVNLYTSEDDRQNVFVTLKAERAAQFANQLAQMFSVPLRAH